MIYLGIDPGTTRIGYGVVEDGNGTFRSLSWGIISNPGINSSADKQATAIEIRKLMDTWRPDVVGVEKLFFLNNKKSVMSVSEMRGVIMLALANSNARVHEFTPLQVKQRICGHGRAEKYQIQLMVKNILHISERVTPDDAADALAIAICCATDRKEY